MMARPSLLRAPGAAARALALRTFSSAAEASAATLRPRRVRVSGFGPALLADPSAALRSSGAWGSSLGATRRAAASSSNGEESDPYKILGVPRSATADEIKAAYRKQAMKWHPDRQPEEDRKVAERKFAAAANAYDTLSDPAKKRQFDSGGGTGGGSPGGGQGGPGGYPGGFPQAGFPGGFPGGVHSQESAERLFREVFGAQGFNEILGQLLGGRGLGGGPGRGQPGEPGVLRAGDEVQVIAEYAAVLRACRRAGIDSSNDALRAKCLGKSGKIIKVDTKDQTVKVSVPNVGDVWLSAQSVRPVRQGGGGRPGGGDPFAAFGNFGAGAGPPGGGGVVQMRQEVVTLPDGTRVMRVTRVVRGPDGSTKTEVYETPL
mmetsp:Transcript_83496/g.239868  ORF Transcript_83496/g.239868 Transcript_83496/m.239868 type:complete len:375 (+) Transcript_83496:29-1153(+)